MFSKSGHIFSAGSPSISRINPVSSKTEQFWWNLVYFDCHKNKNEEILVLKFEKCNNCDLKVNKKLKIG